MAGVYSISSPLSSNANQTWYPVYCELMITRSGWLLSNSSEMATFTEQLLSALEQQDVVDRFSLIFEHQLKSHLDPVTVKLTDAIHALTQTVTQQKGKIKSRDDIICSLQCEVTELQTRVEDLEQHGHHDSLRIFGIPEDEPGSTDDKVLRLCNKRPKLNPPLALEDIAVSHRVGPPKKPAATDTNDPDAKSEPVPPRALLVKFVSRRLRERVMGEEKKLKEPVTQDEDLPHDPDIPSWDDLTRARARLAYQARVLKIDKTILDTWAINCKWSKTNMDTFPKLKQERLKCRNTLSCLDQYAAQNSKYARPPIPSQPPTQKVFFQWHTQYDPTMKLSHCETVNAKELFQWLFFELVHSLRIL